MTIRQHIHAQAKNEGVRVAVIVCEMRDKLGTWIYRTTDGVFMTAVVKEG